MYHSCCGVWGGLGGGGTPAVEICPRGVYGIVDGITNHAGDVAEVAGVSLLGLGFAALFYDPEEAEGGKDADDYARDEAGDEGCS